MTTRHTHRVVLACAILAALAVLPTAGTHLSAVQPWPEQAASGVPGARRIVSLVPATTEMLFAMGAGDRVIGVGTYDHYPPQVESLPKLGGLLDPSIERLIAMRPDLVIVYDTQTELRRQLERSGIPQWGYSLEGLADVNTTMRALGRRIGMEAGGTAAADAMLEKLNTLKARVAGRPRPKALLVFGRDPGNLRNIVASGGYGFLHDLLELAGGVDVLADIKRAAVNMSTEMVLSRGPEAIIELHYGDSAQARNLDAEKRVWGALPAVPAVRNNRVYLLSGNEFVVPGPRVTQVAERFARVLHPDAFKE